MDSDRALRESVNAEEKRAPGQSQVHHGRMCRLPARAPPRRDRPESRSPPRASAQGQAFVLVSCGGALLVSGQEKRWPWQARRRSLMSCRSRELMGSWWERRIWNLLVSALPRSCSWAERCPVLVVVELAASTRRCVRRPVPPMIAPYPPLRGGLESVGKVVTGGIRPM